MDAVLARLDLDALPHLELGDELITDMLTVHHLENSRSQRVLWLLEELGVPYEVKRYERDRKTMLAPAELRAIHPLGKSPVVTDGEQVIAESGAIVEYLVERYGEGRLIPPPNTPERLRYTYWLHYAEGSAMPPLLLKLVFDTIAKGRQAPLLARPILRAVARKVMKAFVTPQLALHLGYIESELGKNPWFAGSELTAADIQMSFPVEAGQARGHLATPTPNMKSFLARIHARPAYERALERGGPYTILESA